MDECLLWNSNFILLAFGG